jgi:hypothetical protein
VPYREISAALRTQSLRAIARHYGVTRNAVRYWRTKLGIPPLDLRPAPCPLDAVVVAALAACPDGATVRDLVQALGKPPGALYPVLTRLVCAGRLQEAVERVPGRAPRRRWMLPPRVS